MHVTAKYGHVTEENRVKETVQCRRCSCGISYAWGGLPSLCGIRYGIPVWVGARRVYVYSKVDNADNVDNVDNVDHIYYIDHIDYIEYIPCLVGRETYHVYSV